MPGKGKPPECMNTGPKPPCGKNCPERKAGCAINCQKWAAYIAERNAHYLERQRRAENDRMNHAKNAAANRIAFKKKNSPGWF